MKITCESCAAQYDLDESRIPPSGVQMKCPACLHQFLVKKPGAQPPPKPAPHEIELSSLEDDHTPLPPDAPGMSSGAPPPRPVVDPGEIDLPAPRAHRQAGGRAAAEEPDLPAPKAAKPPPMPPARKPAPPPVPIAKPDEDLIDLPAPVSARAPAPPQVDEPDLLAPVGARSASRRNEDIVDLPAPKSPAVPAFHVATEADLPAPKRAPSIGLDLDAPEPDDLDVVPPTRSPARSPSAGPPPVDDGLTGLELDAIDVVAPKGPAVRDDDLLAPKHETMELAPKHETMELAPKHETMELAPKHETMDIAPKPETMDVAPKAILPPADRSLDDPTPVEPLKTELPKTKKKAARSDDDEDKPTRSRVPRTLVVLGAVMMVAALVGVGLGVFTDQGYFASNLWSGKKQVTEAKLSEARKLFADDTLASYKRAALDLKQLTDADPKAFEAAALEAESRLAEARLGVSSELRAADTLLARLADAKEPSSEAARAKALERVVTGKLAEARQALQSILSAAPSDAVALTYLGWTELAAGDWSAADQAFGRAVQAESNRPAALFGRGLAKERLGDDAAALEAYGRALARSPQHFGAAVGRARLSAQKSGADAAQQQIEQLIATRSSSVGPRELADAWTSVGTLSALAGRRDQAEDRFRRALALDPDAWSARVQLSQLQCDAGKAAETVGPLQKIVGAQPKNLEARLALVRADVEGGHAKDAPLALAQAVTQAPKDARVLYWQGRVALADKNDREKALGFFKQAVSADPRFIAAYLAESNAFAQSGKPEDAVDALKQAETKASDDPQLMLELGRAYLAIGRAADAEARFRAALTAKPDFTQARLELASALESENKLADAAKEYEQLAATHPDYPGLAERQAKLFAQSGQKDDAWALYQKALSHGVPTHALKLQVASLALDMNKIEDAKKLAGDVAREDDRDAQAHLVLARALLADNHVEEALPEARRAASLADLPEAHLTLGRTLELLGKLDQSVAEYNLARRPPVEALASIGRARIMVRMGATRDALAELTELAKNPKLRPQALLLEGDCYSDLEQKDKARVAYEGAFKAAPDSGEAAFKLGRVYADAGKRKPAVDMLEKAIRLGGDKATFAAEAWLLVGDAHREARENEAAVRAYKKYLELAPEDAPARAEVQKHLQILGGG